MQISFHLVFFSAVIEVAGFWFSNLRDRYSWWYKLIPLLVTGLHDEILEIRLKAQNLWDAAGSLFLKENESDEKIKNKMDFLADDLDHYPPNSALTQIFYIFL